MMEIDMGKWLIEPGRDKLHGTDADRAVCFNQEP